MATQLGQHLNTGDLLRQIRSCHSIMAVFSTWSNQLSC
jgi:hypothetical protein